MKKLINKILGRDERAAEQGAGRNQGGELPRFEFANASSVQLVLHNAAIKEMKARSNFLANCTDHLAAEDWNIARGELHRTENWATKRSIKQEDGPVVQAALGRR